MPTYVYQTMPEDGPIQEFEIRQRMSEDALKEHPDTRVRIRKVPCCVQVGKSGKAHGNQCACCH